MEYIQLTNTLKSLAEEKYRTFIAKLIPNLDKNKILGVRQPALKKLAKTYEKEQSHFVERFLGIRPHQYYEENQLHSIFLSQMTSFEQTLKEVEAFLPYVDNWATCDALKPKSFEGHQEKLDEYCRRWLQSQHIYTIRFGIKMRMDFYLDDAYHREHLSEVANVNFCDYYVEMAAAWYYATAMIDHFEDVIACLKKENLSSVVLKKSIQKGIESNRIDGNKKEILRKWRHEI